MRKLLVALGATFLVLLGTGLYQTYRYTPRGSAFVDDATELVHRLGSGVFCALALAVIALWIVRERTSTRATLVTVVVLTVLGLATVAQVITGRGLRWTQLALLAVTAGAIDGVVDLPNGVKYVFVGRAELTGSEFSTRVFLHVIVFPVGLVLVGAVLWYLSTRNGRLRGALHPTVDGPGDADEDDEDDADDADDEMVEAPT